MAKYDWLTSFRAAIILQMCARVLLQAADAPLKTCWKNGALPTPCHPSSERQARPIQWLKTDSSHLAYPIGLFVSRVWLKSPSSIPRRCLKSYAITVQIICQNEISVWKAQDRIAQ